MLHITFTPESQNSDLARAAREYESIWKAEGDMIVKALEKVSGLTFIESTVRVIVYEGMSFSGKDTESPMRLRASYDAGTKKAALIHELGHRLLFQVHAYGELDEHQVLNLFLYDTWIELYGKPFADEQVAIESGRKGHYDYERTWEWALDMTPTERAAKLWSITKLQEALRLKKT